MSSRGFAIFLVVGILITAAGAGSIYFLLYKKNSQLSKNLSSLKSKLNGLQSKKNALEFLKRKKIETAEENIKYKNILPSKMEKRELDFTSLVENAYREQANNITFESTKKIEERITATPGKPPTAANPNIEKVSYEYKMVGKFADIVTFISLVESGDWFMKVDKLSIKRVEKDVEVSKGTKVKAVFGECTLTVSGYFFKE